MSEKDVKDQGLENLVANRKNKGGRKPGMTGKVIVGGKEARKKDKVWLPACRKPNKEEKKRMLGWMMEIAMTQVMENHYYSFENTVRRQKKGGVIGGILPGGVGLHTRLGQNAHG